MDISTTIIIVYNSGRLEKPKIRVWGLGGVQRSLGLSTLRAACWYEDCTFIGGRLEWGVWRLRVWKPGKKGLVCLESSNQ